MRRTLSTSLTDGTLLVLVESVVNLQKIVTVVGGIVIVVVVVIVVIVVVVAVAVDCPLEGAVATPAMSSASTATATATMPLIATSLEIVVSATIVAVWDTRFETAPTDASLGAAVGVVVVDVDAAEAEVVAVAAHLVAVAVAAPVASEKTPEVPPNEGVVLGIAPSPKNVLRSVPRALRRKKVVAAVVHRGIRCCVACPKSLLPLIVPLHSDA